MRVGLVGLGRMGSAILPHLFRGGASVAVWNRTQSKTVEAKALGATIATTPRQLVEISDIVLSILYDDASVEEVYCGPSGLLTGDCAGRLFLEMSTIQPDTIQKLGLSAAARGATLLDAPVSGSVGPARDGKLLVLAGGAPEDVERARPVLELFARRVQQIGPLGSAMAMKLGIQSLIYVYWQALGEALALGAQFGISTETMLDVIADSPAALAALKSKIPAIVGADANVAFTLAAAAKDFDLILATGQSLGLSMPVSASSLDCFKRALKSGYGQRDIASIVNLAVTGRLHSS